MKVMSLKISGRCYIRDHRKYRYCTFAQCNVHMKQNLQMHITGVNCYPTAQAEIAKVINYKLVHGNTVYSSVPHSYTM
jgi:hypothetical protein